MELRNKKVLVVGLGTTGITTARFLTERGANVTVSEIKTEDELSSTIPKLREQGVVVEAGGHRRKTFLDANLIVVSPGVPGEMLPLKEAAKSGIEIVSEIELASRYIHIPIIAVTGTNGKTTTVNLIAEIFKTCGKRIFLGGNVGNPLIEYVLHHYDKEYIIAEISSFQLEAIHSFKPHISVLLNLQHDHLDRYHSYDDYIAAKTRIFMNQNTGDYAILNADDVEIHKLAPSINASTLYFSCEKEVPYGIHYRESLLHFTNGTGETCFSLDHVSLKGTHNLQNTMAAVAVSKLCGCEQEGIQEAIENFRGLPHRLEFIKEHNKIRFYNDSKATNVGSVMSALEALDPPLILIAGGKDKGGDYQPLITPIKEKVKALILLGEAKEKMHQALNASSVQTFLVENLEEATKKAITQASPGDSIVLSPACSSFDMFKNYEERGNVFKKLINTLS